MADKNINVVQIIGGPFSFYADWVREDPVLGVNKWQTFVNEELPPLVDAALGSNGVNAIAGLSMAGTSVLNMDIAKPGHFRSVAVYSGIAQTSDPIGQRMVRATVEIWGGGDTRNTWGPVDDPLWAANDPIRNAEKLRGANIFASTGNGIPATFVYRDTAPTPGVTGRTTSSPPGRPSPRASTARHSPLRRAGAAGRPVGPLPPNCGRVASV